MKKLTTKQEKVCEEIFNEAIHISSDGTYIEDVNDDFGNSNDDFEVESRKVCRGIFKHYAMDTELQKKLPSDLVKAIIYATLNGC